MSEEGITKAPPELADAIDRSIGLQLISIRLPVAMIEDYKLVAQISGQLYQPLMREAMALWIDEKKTEILRGVLFDRREAGRTTPEEDTCSPTK
jgi:hypothetical protein